MISDKVLWETVKRVRRDPDVSQLSGTVVKQRLKFNESEKSGGDPTVVILLGESRAVFACGFGTKEPAILAEDEEAVLRKAAKIVLTASDSQIESEVKVGRLVKVKDDG